MTAMTEYDYKMQENICSLCKNAAKDDMTAVFIFADKDKLPLLRDKVMESGGKITSRLTLLGAYGVNIPMKYIKSLAECGFVNYIHMQK